ncbi:MAG: ATPase [Clostridiales bacterium]|nr:ATPase [Clostridiales bacterium]
MRFILISVMLLVLATIGTGAYFMTTETSGKKIKKALGFNLAVYIPMMLIAIGFAVPEIVYAVSEGEAGGTSGLGFIAVALSTGLAAIGAGYAVGTVGSAALGAVSEDPKILGKTLIFVGLAEGIAIYGLIISIIILGRL